MTRIVFLDDDQLLLDGLRNALRSDRRRWDLEFCLTEEEAVAAMATGLPIDIVVCDVDMRRTNGQRFLEQSKAAHPAATRIAFSGDSGDDRQTCRLATIAHRVIPKPSPTPVVREALERTCDLRTLLANPQLLEAVGGADSLPAAPAVLARLDAALADPDSSTRDVAAIVEQDPAVSAEIIHLVNSAFFGLPRTITNLTEAVGYLGMQTLRQLALTVCLTDSAGGGTDANSALKTSVRRRALPTATLARHIAKDLPDPTPNDAFLAGLLHDVGILLLASRLPDRYLEILIDASHNKTPLPEAEIRYLNTTHAEVGACLLGLWGVTMPVVEAVAHHHHPRHVNTDAFDLPATVHTAQALIANTMSKNETGTGLDDALLREKGLADRLSAWTAAAQGAAEGALL